MKFHLILILFILLSACVNSTDRQTNTWNKRITTAVEKCLTKDSLIYLHKLDSSCSCKNIVIEREEHCDSLLSAILNKNK